MSIIKSIALYLPQFHPIPQNDKWWGKGFTEWTNVTKAKPLFKNHWQPRLPSDLGFYDLRVPESRDSQAMLAKEYGIHGFCYWHYWFGGQRLIERPFMDVVKTGKPDFPFCLAWANQTWQGTWHGASHNMILVEQNYPGVDDYTAHFYSLIEAFHDKRYIEVEGKKLVFIFRPMEIPDPLKFISLWQELAIKEGFKGIHFVGMHMPSDWKPSNSGYDAMVQNWLSRDKFKKFTLKQKIERKFFNGQIVSLNKLIKKFPNIVSYIDYINNYPEFELKEDEYPMVYVDWDNTPRAGNDGWLFDGACPELFGKLCTKAFEQTSNKSENEKIVIIKSWNEWAEGNYLEPDQKHGLAFLEAYKRSLNKFQSLHS